MKNKMNFKELSDAELVNKVEELRKEKFNARAQAKAGQNENPVKIRTIRRNIARALTEQSARAKRA